MRTARKGSGRQTLVWRRTGAVTDQFALYAGDRKLAVLRLGGFAGPVAQVDVADLRLVFLSYGLAGRCIRVCDASTNAAVARYEPNWRGAGGTLQLAEGGQLRWMRAGLLSSDWMFANGDGQVLVRVAADGTVTSLVAEDPAAADLWLVLALGWLLIVLAKYHQVSPPPTPLRSVAI